MAAQTGRNSQGRGNCRRATVHAEDLAGLRHLAERLGLVTGYVLCTGQQTLPFGDRLRALPIDALWHTAP